MKLKVFLVFCLAFSAFAFISNAQTKNHLDVVISVLNRLKQENKNYPGPCGGLYITNEVAKELQKQGEDAGILSKTTGNNCIGYSQDIIVYKDGNHYDILIGGEDLCRNASWQYAGPTDPSRWREPIDSASIPVGSSGTCKDDGGGGGGGGIEIKIPQIFGANPNNPKPGDKVTILGANLTERIQLYLISGGRPIELTASLNSQKNNATITLPKDISPGDYFVVVISEAGGTPSQNVVFTVQDTNPQPSLPQQEIKDFGDLIENIFTWALWLVGAAVFVNFLWAGFLWFTAAGRPGPIGQAKEKMTNALIGAIILLSSYLILNTINPDLVKQTFILPGL